MEKGVYRGHFSPLKYQIERSDSPDWFKPSVASVALSQVAPAGPQPSFLFRLNKIKKHARTWYMMKNRAKQNVDQHGSNLLPRVGKNVPGSV